MFLQFIPVRAHLIQQIDDFMRSIPAFSKTSPIFVFLQVNEYENLLRFAPIVNKNLTLLRSTAGNDCCCIIFILLFNFVNHVAIDLYK